MVFVALGGGETTKGMRDEQFCHTDDNWIGLFFVLVSGRWYTRRDLEVARVVGGFKFSETMGFFTETMDGRESSRWRSASD